MIDPRTLVPLDLDAIVESVQAHQSPRRRARGGEARRLRRGDRRRRCEAAAFDYLDAPVARVGAPFAPIPLSAPLEDAYLPGADEVYAAAKALV